MAANLVLSNKRASAVSERNCGDGTCIGWAVTMPNVLDRFVLVALLSIVGRVFLAAEPTSADSTTAADQLKALRDQTIIQSRVSIDTEWDQFDGGAEKAKWTLGGLWGWHVRDQQDWALRFKVPFVYNRGDGSSGHTDIGCICGVRDGTRPTFCLTDTSRTRGWV